MNEIIVKSQAELDALPSSFSEQTVIKIDCANWVTVQRARENSHVEARENSHVVARENSHVEAWENSHVEARENSHVEARENTCTWNFSVHADVTLFMFAVCFLMNKAKAVKKSKTATIITPKSKPGTNGWLEASGVNNSRSVILFKRVSGDFKTQEGTPNETIWKIGSRMAHKAWKPKEHECGGGKFHACSRPYLCDRYRTTAGDIYIAIEIQKKDLYAWPNPEHPNKIAFRAGKVLHQCDAFGNKIEAKS